MSITFLAPIMHRRGVKEAAAACSGGVQGLRVHGLSWSRNLPRGIPALTLLLEVYLQPGSQRACAAAHTSIQFSRVRLSLCTSAHWAHTPRQGCP